MFQGMITLTKLLCSSLKFIMSLCVQMDELVKELVLLLRLIRQFKYIFSIFRGGFCI